MEEPQKYKVIEEYHYWTCEEKLKWLGYGEWVEELDAVRFDYLGYEGFVMRIVKREPCEKEAYFGGHLCGYVTIPPGHPFFGKEDVDVTCHGGLTFSTVQEKHMIGFDCGHAVDLVPTMKATQERITANIMAMYSLSEEMMKSDLFNPSYKNMDYCIAECMAMIDQLVAVHTALKEQN